MENEASSCTVPSGLYKKFKPHILIFITQKSKAKAHNRSLWGNFCAFSAWVVTVTLNAYFASLKYSSPTFLASMINTIASFTFFIAVVLRLEVLDLRKPHGIAKVGGTLVYLARVIIMTFYKGQAVRNLGHPLIHIQGKNSTLKDRLKGSILGVSSCITWSMFYIMQAFTLNRYPAQLSLTTWMSFVGGAQSAVLTVIMQHNRAAWTIGFDIDLWSTGYGGMVCSGLIIFIQLWCTVEKGPVFVTVFNPVSTILVAILAYFVLRERLYTGSIIGAIIAIIGPYYAEKPLNMSFTTDTKRKYNKSK